MKEDIRKIRMRQKWLGIYTKTGSVTKTALRCGIARSTLYRWINCEKEQGKSKLSDKTEFWNLIDLSDKTLDLNAMAMEWQEFYNKKRPHSSLNEILPRNYEYLKFIKHRNKKAVVQ